MANSLSELMNQVKKSVMSASEDLAENIEYTLKDRVDKDVYDAYEPKKYERTYELRDSITKDASILSDNTIEVGASHKTDLILPHGVNQHVSIMTGNDVSAFIPNIVQDGAFPLFSNGAYTLKRNYMETAREIVDKNKKKVLQDALKKRGINGI